MIFLAAAGLTVPCRTGLPPDPYSAIDRATSTLTTSRGAESRIECRQVRNGDERCSVRILPRQGTYQQCEKGAVPEGDIQGGKTPGALQEWGNW